MTAARICLLGPFRMRLSGAQCDTALGARSRALLARLLLDRGSRIPRDVLANDFWPETSNERARRALSTELWRLRRSLAGQGWSFARELTMADCDAVGIVDGDGLWVDTEAFESDVVGLDDAACDAALCERVAGALALYRGAYLPGHDDEWVLVARERFRARLEAGLAWLMRERMRAGDWAAALVYARKLLEADNLLEHVHRAAMECHLRLGNRAAAVRQYQELAAVLASELGVEPMEETTALVWSIARRSASTQAVSQRKDAAISELDEAIACLERARRKLIALRARSSPAA